MLAGLHLQVALSLRFSQGRAGCYNSNDTAAAITSSPTAIPSA